MFGNLLTKWHDKRRFRDLYTRYQSTQDDSLDHTKVSDFKTHKYQLFFEVFALWVSKSYRESVDIESHAKDIYNDLATELSGASNIAYLRFFLITVLESLPEAPSWIHETPTTFSFRRGFVDRELKEAFRVMTAEEISQHTL